MNKPQNYDATQLASDFVPVELGAHYAIIKNVSERETKNGDPMIVVSIDFDKKDEQAGYFTEMFKKDIRPEKKYPNQATNYIMSEYNGECTRAFKAFIKNFADSNCLKESDIKWGDDFTSQFKNKKIGVVFGNVEELYNGEVKMRRKIRWFCDYAKVSNQDVPKDQLLDASKKESAKPSTSTDSRIANINMDIDEEEIPFE